MIPFTWNLLLALLWMILTGVFTGPSFVVGFLFGYICLAMMERHIPVLDGYSRKVPGTIGFVLFFIWSVIKSNVRVAVDVASPRSIDKKIKPGVIGLPLQLNSPVGITILANFITLTPGTLSLDVSDDHNVLYVHAMYLDDEHRQLAELKEIEQRIIALMGDS